MQLLEKKGRRYVDIQTLIQNRQHVFTLEVDTDTYYSILDKVDGVPVRVKLNLEFDGSPERDICGCFMNDHIGECSDGG